MIDRHHRSYIAGAISASVFALALLLWPKAEPTGRLTVANIDAPVVMHTSGGRLEVATVTATEAVKLNAPPKSLLGIDLGTTISNVQAKVVYRYHIEMAKEWPIKFKGTTAIVEAGEIKPSLPVAFDTKTMEKQTQSGWARFDKHDNMDNLERELSPVFEKRSHGYKSIALESARKSVSDFVRTWLIKEKQWQPGSPYLVQVVFPGEPVPGGTTAQPH